ncbi:MAG: DUF4212 domain-containing protein, partial [Hyphomicrobiaceae bacterium]|nr:DUF4212 domain-containing protein [Hyphomicrobiaceae bacterium]
MTEIARGYWRGTRRLAISAFVVWAVLVLAVPLAAHQLEVIAVMGMPLSYYVGAQGILIGVTMLAFVFAHRQRRLDNARKDGTNPLRPERARPWARADGVPGLTGALAMAGDWLSGAMLLTLAGALYALGHDGLSWLIGLFAGVALGGMLIGPHVHRSGAASVTGFLAQRFGAVAGALAALIAALVTMLLLAANAKALVAVLAALMPDMRYGSEAGILSIAVVFIAAALRSGKPGMTTVQAVAYPLLAAVLAMLVVVTSKGIAPNIFTYGATLQAISSAELSLLQGELADPVSLKAYLRAFTTATPWDAVLLTLSLALGIAAVPHVLARPVAARSHEGARLMPAAALMMMLVATLALAPLAAMTRHGMLTLLTGQPVGSLPPVVTEMGSRGLLDVCGVPAVSQQVVTAACAALEEPPTTALRLHDMSVTSGTELLAMPWLAGLPSPAATILAVAVGIAAVLGAAAVDEGQGQAHQPGRRLRAGPAGEAHPVAHRHAVAARAVEQPAHGVARERVGCPVGQVIRGSRVLRH